MEVKKHYSNTTQQRKMYDLTEELIYMEQGHVTNSRSSQMPVTEMSYMINAPDSASKLNRIAPASSEQENQLDSSIIIGNCNQKLNTQLLVAVDSQNIEEVGRLLKAGANPNANCRESNVSVCHIAALNGGEVLPLLLEAGAKSDRFDKLGRTPLHLAAWAGNAKEIAILLDLPKDLQTKICDKNMSSETEEEVKQLIPSIYKKTINVVCDTGVINILPRAWIDDINYACKDITEHIPILKQKWTPLHAASYCARAHSVQLLLAAGADPDVKDLKGDTPLDVAGYAVYDGHSIDTEQFTETINLLVKAVGRNNKLHGGVKINGPLHTAIELRSLEALKLLLDTGVSCLPLNKDGLTPMHVCVKKELKEHLQLLVNHEYSQKVSAVNCRDKDGYTVLHAAVRSGWIPGIRVALEAGAGITLMANNGETALHEGAANGNLEVLNELLVVAKNRGVIDCLNEKKETPFLTAVREGHLECVQKLLKEGASIKQKLPGSVNVLHIASEKGHLDVLSYLINRHFATTHKMINYPNENRRYGDTPLQCAVINNHSECVELLLSKNADVRYDSRKGFLSSPLHIAVMNNNCKLTNMILDFDESTLNSVNCLGWTPLHTACRYASRECIRVLLQRGADMSRPCVAIKTETAFSMIMNNLSKPTEFMEDIFDSCIKYRTEPIEKASVIDIDYSILAPNGEKKQMKVINTLCNSGNRYNQKKLLLHPLVKSFLYLKWKALLPFFYTILILYSSFVISLTMLIMSVFTYKYNNEVAPAWLNTTFWSYVVFGALFFVVILEIIYTMNIKSKTYFLHMEFWVRVSSIIMGIILAPALVVTQSDAEWIRHLSTLAVIVSWLEMMFVLSRFPKWGYYFLMFGTVASKMLKILLSFTFLLIGFSLGFMIQFHLEGPFDSFWSAIVKTMVMMISEFNYDGMFKETYSKELATILLQIIFLVFIIATAVVLMNMMVGVAVNDVQNLELIGNIKRIVKQIDLLGSLELLVYSNIFHRILPKHLNRSLQQRRDIRRNITLQLGNSFNENILPLHIIDTIFDQAFTIKKRTEDQVDTDIFKNQVNEIYKTTVLKTGRHEIPSKNPQDGLVDTINNKKIFIKDRKQYYGSNVNDEIIHKLSIKIEQMNLKIASIEHSLLRIENYCTKRKSIIKTWRRGSVPAKTSNFSRNK